MANLSELSSERAARVARSSYGRLVSLLAARDGDIGAAEDALADAFEQALLRWPDAGIPENPEAWLLTVARNRRRDRARSPSTRAMTPLEEIAELAALQEIDVEAIPDRRLALLFVCAHPAIEPLVRAPLMLQTILGFGAERIAVAFAVPAPMLAQRLVRAKRRIRDARIPFVVPDRSIISRRLPDVLEAVYGAYAIEWYGVAGATERGTLETEALYLAETLADLLPDEPETLGLAALVCLSLSRAPARLDSNGALVPLQEQQTSRWDATLIERGERYLMRAHRLGCIGRFQLEAAIQSVHCDRRRTGVTDWSALRKFHGALVEMAPTLGATVSLAVVLGETDGPDAGLAILDTLDGAHAGRFQPAWVARAHLQAAAGDYASAAESFRKAISLTTDPPTRSLLQRQAGSLPGR